MFLYASMNIPCFPFISLILNSVPSLDSSFSSQFEGILMNFEPPFWISFMFVCSISCAVMFGFTS